jgi:hypothetical protein
MLRGETQINKKNGKKTIRGKWKGERRNNKK